MLQKRTFLFFSILAFLFFSACRSAKEEQHNSMRLWYAQAAHQWEEALPIGNGRLGAMVYGGIETDCLQFNEETLWAGEPGNNILPEIKEHLPQIQQYIFEGKYPEAQALANKYLPRRAGAGQNYGMCYQALADLHLIFPDSDSIKNYRRELDIENAIASVSYESKHIHYQRRYIASLSDDIMAIELRADRAAAINCTLKLSSEHTRTQLHSDATSLWLRGFSEDYEGKKGKVQFTSILQPKVIGGQMHITDSSIQIQDADEVTLYLSAATNFVNYQDISGSADQKAKDLLDQAYKKDFFELAEAHSARHKQYFNRVKLDLGSTNSMDKPTDQRIAEFKNGNDPQLVALYFQFGRYLLIASSQPGTQAANLQGLWNQELFPSWDSKYTVNINTEMNYWPAEATQLSELHEPLFSLIHDMATTGRASASQIYGARGWNMHHNTDIWRISGVVDGGYYGLWPMGGAWLTQHLWYHYVYTGDTIFLKSAYPTLKELSLFYKDMLVEEPEHHWQVVCPSMSPENAHQSKVSLAAGTTMDNQLLFDVFSNVIQASEVLGVDRAYADSLRNLRSQLAPMQIGSWGQLQEWMHDWDRPNDKHRHVSHLYGLFPSNQISPLRTPELAAAAKTSLLARGDASTGWSMGWKVNLWARLLDGNHALKLISDQLSPSIQPDGTQQGGTYPNLLDAHPPFQIDGNFGCTSGITEMLLQSHDGAIHLLPALPDAWSKGEVKGLVARGGFIVNMHWDEGKLCEATLKSTIGGNCRIRSYIPLRGKNLQEASGTNPNPLFALPEIAQPLNHSQTVPDASRQIKVYDYDLATKAGETLRLKAGS